MAKEYDPRMHTAEHVLNQTMVRYFGCARSFTSHLNAGKSKCDYHFDQPVSEKDMQQIQDIVNDTLRQHLVVSERMVIRSEAEKLVSLTKLPASVGANDPIRIVTVGDYDICPCIGAHVANTKDVGIFRIVSHEYTAPVNAGHGVLRVRFSLGVPV